MSYSSSSSEKRFSLTPVLITLMVAIQVLSAGYALYLLGYDVVHQPKDPPELSEREFDCLARNIYFEAGNQSMAGRVAVGLVTLNRANDPRFPSTICGVVQQASSRRVICQFSWYCLKGLRMKSLESDAWDSAKESAIMANHMYHKGYDITNGATHFHASYVKPAWAKSLEKVARIDDHIFYK